MKRQIKKTVYKILSNEPYSRENDGYLIMRVIQELEPAMFKNDFEEVMQNLQVKGISFEGITRARRKFFEENPNLKIKKAEEARRKKEEEYFLEYANHYTIDQEKIMKYNYKELTGKCKTCRTAA